MIPCITNYFIIRYRIILYNKYNNKNNTVKGKGECSWKMRIFQLTNFRTRYLKEFFRDKIFYLHLSTSGSRRKALRDCLLPSKNTIMLVKRQSFLTKKHAHGIIEYFVIRIDDYFVISASFSPLSCVHSARLYMRPMCFALKNMGRIITFRKLHVDYKFL